MKKSVNDLVDVIRDIIQEEINKEDDMVLCQVREQKDEYHYDVSLISDPNTVIHNLANTTRYVLKDGDYVYAYKIKNQLSNSFIFSKVVPYIPETKCVGSYTQVASYTAVGYTVYGTTETAISCAGDTYILGYTEA